MPLSNYSSRRRKMPSKLKIAQHWLANRQADLLRFEFDAEEWTAEEFKWMCWACQLESDSVQRCHLIPREFGGPDIPDNLVLLCAECHFASPSISTTPEPMLAWIASCPPRAIRRSRFIRDILGDLSSADVEELGSDSGVLRLKAGIGASMRKISTNMGSVSDATMKWVLTDAIRSLVKTGT